MSVNSDRVYDDRLTLSEASTLNALLTNFAQRQDCTRLLQATPRDLIYMRYTNFNQQAFHPFSYLGFRIWLTSMHHQR